MAYFSRVEWGARAANGGPGPLSASNVEGIALHWPALERPMRGVENVKDGLRSWQRMHMDTNGWSDIAYQAAVDQDGNIYELRGLSVQPGANGDEDVNERFGAILLVLAPGENPSAEMVRSTRQVIEWFRSRFPRARRIVGHSQVRPEPTACPGPVVLALIKSGEFEPRKPKTRGAHIKAALRSLGQAEGAGQRRAEIDAAIAALRRIKFLKG